MMWVWSKGAALRMENMRWIFDIKEVKLAEFGWGERERNDSQISGLGDRVDDGSEHTGAHLFVGYLSMYLVWYFIL